MGVPDRRGRGATEGHKSDNWLLDGPPLADQERVRYPPIANASRMADWTASALFIKCTSRGTSKLRFSIVVLFVSLSGTVAI